MRLVVMSARRGGLSQPGREASARHCYVWPSRSLFLSPQRAKILLAIPPRIAYLPTSTEIVCRHMSVSVLFRHSAPAQHSPPTHPPTQPTHPPTPRLTYPPSHPTHSPNPPPHPPPHLPTHPPTQPHSNPSTHPPTQPSAHPPNPPAHTPTHPPTSALFASTCRAGRRHESQVQDLEKRWLEQIAGLKKGEELMEIERCV